MSQNSHLTCIRTIFERNRNIFLKGKRTLNLKWFDRKLFPKSTHGVHLILYRKNIKSGTLYQCLGMRGLILPPSNLPRFFFKCIFSERRQVIGLFLLLHGYSFHSRYFCDLFWGKCMTLKLSDLKEKAIWCVKKDCPWFSNSNTDAA